LPRSVAIAGSVYLLLMLTGMILAVGITVIGPEDITGKWL
jgi:hypothetical protein